MDEIKIGDKVIAKIFDKSCPGEVEDIYISTLGKPSLYKLKGSSSLFDESEITLYKDVCES
ncbi:hypothetical protein [Lysinibacillus sp. LZ02]|uniref:hypothetical protein n=1 Tax=Lysinibacillus sp. LZ02 TaxID=3420668 RepID=UPI003D36D286